MVDPKNLGGWPFHVHSKPTKPEMALLVLKEKHVTGLAAKNAFLPRPKKQQKLNTDSKAQSVQRYPLGGNRGSG